MSNVCDQRPIAFILGSDLRVEVALARALCDLGRQTWVLQTRPGLKTTRSRYISHSIDISDQPGAGLLKLLRRNPDAILLPWGDSSLELLRTLSPLEAKLAQQVCSDCEHLDWVLDKRLTLKAAAQVAIPYPPGTEDWRGREPGELLEAFGPSVIVKPANKRVPAQFKIKAANNRIELTSILRALEGRSEPYLLQRKLNGDPVGLGCVRSSDGRVDCIQFRSQREWPAAGGNTVLARTERVDPRLRNAATALLEHIGWHGIAHVEFLHDHQTDEFHLMEINGRIWASIDLAIAAGFNPLSALLAPAPEHTLDATRDPSMESEYYRIDMVQHWLGGDIRRVVQIARDRGVGVDFTKAIAAAMWSSIRPTAMAVFRLQDPVPFFQDLARALSNR